MNLVKQYSIEFFSTALYAGSVAVLGWNRPKFDCNVNYCHYRSPQKFLENLEIDENLTKPIGALLIFLVGFRVVAFYIMSYRMKH